MIGKFSMRRFFLGLAVLGVGLVGATGNAELITNGDFNDNAANAFPGYGAPAGWAASPGVGVNLGDTGHSVFADNGSTDGLGVAFLQNPGRILGQTVTGVTVGDTLVLSFEYNTRTFTDVANNGTLGVTVNISGVGDVVSDLAVNAAAGANPYFSTSVEFDAVSESFDINFLSTGSGGNGDRTLLLDNVSLTVVPEPGSFALAAAGASLMAFRRRSIKYMSKQ